VLAAIVLLLAGDLGSWLTLDRWAQALRMAVLIACAMVGYGAALWLGGLRPRHFRAARRI
jgi:hypothetical protein